MHHLRNYVAALLLLLGVTVHAVIYRTIQLEAKLNATLPCHELEHVDDLRMWVTPNRVYVGVDFNPDHDKFVIDEGTGSLEVLVSPIIINAIINSIFN